MYIEENKQNNEKILENELKNTIDSMQLDQNNISGEFADLRDTFLDAEKEYVLSLLKDESLKDFVISINKFYNINDLVKIVQDLVEKVENNLIPYEEMEKVENKIIILLAAIKDKILVKVKEYETEEIEISYSR